MRLTWRRGRDGRLFVGAAARQGVAYSKSGPVVTLADVDFDLDHAKTQ